MKKTEKYLPTADEYAEHIERCAPVPAGESVKRGIARTDTTYFVVNQLGMVPYVWQSKFWDMINDGYNTLACTGRQVGKTFSLAAWILQAITYNTMPIEPDNKTHIVIVSASEEQSKKIVSDIKMLMRVGDERVEQLTGGKVKNFFTNHINRSQNATNTKSAIEFENGCTVQSLPPTERARGYTASILFIDEAAFITDDDIYHQTLKHITAKTGGRVCMTSTPNGTKGFFYRFFDPNDELEGNEWKRIWMTYEGTKYDDPQGYLRRLKDKEIQRALGNERQWRQEQEADFTVSTTNYFDEDDIAKGARKTLDFVQEWNDQCDLAVDFGNKYSRTVISISALEGKGDNKRIRLLYQRAYRPDEDLPLIEDIMELRSRFKIQRILFEDCSAASPFAQMAEKKGLPFEWFNPTRDKAPTYANFRSWLRRGKLVYPDKKDLIEEMKSLVQEDTPRTTKIFHGPGMRDDRIDSFVISTYYLTQEKRGLKVWDI